MLDDMEAQSLLFATRAHDGQLRKYANVLYVVHPIHVASMAKQCGLDVVTVCAAYLHDI